jgi:hypothetical protein
MNNKISGGGSPRGLMLLAIVCCAGMLEGTAAQAGDLELQGGGSTFGHGSKTAYFG